MKLSDIIAVVPGHQEILIKFGEHLVEASAEALRECLSAQTLSSKVEKLYADGAFLQVTLKLKKGKGNEERNL